MQLTRYSLPRFTQACEHCGLAVLLKFTPNAAKVYILPTMRMGLMLLEV